MTSPTAICNRALGRLGESSIMDMDEVTTAGRACRLHFAPTRDALLRSHAWNWATKRVTLTQAVPAPLFNWAYRYGLPADSLRLLEVNGSDVSLLRNWWKIEGDGLLSNEATMEVVYIYRCEDTNLWDPLFCDAMAVKLAIHLSETMRGGSSADEKLMAEYDRITAPLARRVDANENRPRESLLPWNSRFVGARGNYGGYDPEISGYGLY